MKVNHNTEISTLEKAIFDLHGVKAVWIESVAIKEIFKGKTVWKGVVEVFDIKGQSHATKCYA